MLEFYHAPESRSLRTLWLLEETGLDYAMRYVSIVYGDGRGQRDPVNVHPDGKVPAIVRDGTLVTESYAIAMLLADLVPETGLAPAPGSAERGSYLAWLLWAATELEPVLGPRVYGAGDPAQDGAFAAAVRRIDTALAAGDYLLGDRFTAVDVMIGGTLAWGRTALPDSDALDAYLDRIADRPAYAAACAKDAPLTAAA